MLNHSFDGKSINIESIAVLCSRVSVRILMMNTLNIILIIIMYETITIVGAHQVFLLTFLL